VLAMAATRRCHAIESQLQRVVVQAMDETMAKKPAEDVAAYVRSLAGGRHRKVELAEQR
jgi:hypothetical protein